MNIIKKYIVNNDCYKANENRADSRYTTFQQRGPQGLVLHSVGCAQPKALVFANAWNVPNKEVAVHAVLQADGTVYQCMPWNFRGWHVGGSANNTHAGVEMTEPASLTYTSGGKFTCSDLPGARKFVKECFDTAVELFAMICTAWNLNPLADGVIISHKEANARGIGSNHGDPEHLWTGLGMDLNMNKFRTAVDKKMKGEDQVTKAEVQTMINTAVTALDTRLTTDWTLKLNNALTTVQQSLDAIGASLQLLDTDLDAISDTVTQMKKVMPKHYELLKDVTEKWYRPTMNMLIERGYMAGKGGKGENTIIDFDEDTIRMFVILNRVGIFDILPPPNTNG